LVRPVFFHEFFEIFTRLTDFARKLPKKPKVPEKNQKTISAEARCELP